MPPIARDDLSPKGELVREVQRLPHGVKRLHEMDRLADMGHFPVSVHAGATANVLLTLIATWFAEPRFTQPYAPIAWIGAILACNLLPVALLRLTLTHNTHYPPVDAMSFWSDQHKFADWVYVAASANMAFWVLAAWALFSRHHTHGMLAAILATAFLVTFAPVLRRMHRQAPMLL